MKQWMNFAIQLGVATIIRLPGESINLSQTRMNTRAKTRKLESYFAFKVQVYYKMGKLRR